MLIDVDLLKKCQKADELPQAIKKLRSTLKDKQMHLNSKLSNLHLSLRPQVCVDLDFKFSQQILSFYIDYMRIHSSLKELEMKSEFLDRLSKEVCYIYNKIKDLSSDCYYKKALSFKNVVEFSYSFNAGYKLLVSNLERDLLAFLRRSLDEWVSNSVRVSRQIGCIFLKEVSDLNEMVEIRDFDELRRFVPGSMGFYKGDTLGGAQNIRDTLGGPQNVRDGLGGAHIERDGLKSTQNKRDLPKNTHIQRDLPKNTHIQRDLPKNTHIEGGPGSTPGYSPRGPSAPNPPLDRDPTHITKKDLLAVRTQIRKDLQMPKLLIPVYIHEILNKDIITFINLKRSTIIQNLDMESLIGYLHIESLLFQKNNQFQIEIFNTKFNIEDSIKIYNALLYFNLKYYKMENIVAKKCYDHILKLKPSIKSFSGILSFINSCYFPKIQTVCEFYCSCVDSFLVQFYENSYFEQCFCCLEHMVRLMSLYEDNPIGDRDLDIVNETGNINEDLNFQIKNTNKISNLQTGRNHQTDQTDGNLQIDQTGKNHQTDQTDRNLQIDQTGRNHQIDQTDGNLQIDQTGRNHQIDQIDTTYQIDYSKQIQRCEYLLQSDFKISKLLNKEIKTQKDIIKLIFNQNKIKKLQTDIIYHPLIIKEIIKYFEKDIVNLENELVSFFVFIRARDSKLSHMLKPLIVRARNNIK